VVENILHLKYAVNFGLLFSWVTSQKEEYFYSLFLKVGTYFICPFFIFTPALAGDSIGGRI